MKDPLVSVTMITYNHSRFIAAAIQGVLSQKTDFPIELVIGEDCSTDGTREIVAGYQKKFPDIVKVITSDKNVGMMKNSVRTMRASKGTYIAFCEGDDYWHNPRKLQKQVDYFERHPECGLVYSSYDVFNVDSGKKVHDFLNNFIKKENWQRPNNPSVLDFLEGKPKIGYGILTCTVMVRRILYQQIVESDPYLHQSGRFLRGDTQLWAEIAHRFPIHYIPESLATYNQTAESATRSKDITKPVRLQISDAELGLYLCNKYNLPLSTRNLMEAIKYNSFLRLAFHTRNAKLADQVRTEKKSFTWKEWLLYYGAKSRVLYYPFRLGASVRNFSSKFYEQWL